MRPLLSPAEMASADQAAISGGTPAEALMERAGRALAREVVRVAGRRYGLRVAVVCGKGNNGGDGFAAARALLREGASARCFAVGDTDAIEGPAAVHLKRLRSAGGRVDPFSREAIAHADVAVDALFGTGFKGAVEGAPARAIRALNESGTPVVAADIPSGVVGETGAVEGAAVEAVATVAMGAEKIGTAVGAGAALAGRVTVADIGIPTEGSSVNMTEASDVARVLPRRAPAAHKRSGGAVALLTGSRDMTGAAVLAAQGALRMGAGYVTLGSTHDAVAAAQALLPELLCLRLSEQDHLDASSLAGFASVVDQADAVAIGPGLGRGDDQRALVEKVLAEVDVPVVLDADALNVLAKHTRALETRASPAVITPHPAELARLLEVEVADVQGDRLAAARGASGRFGCVVLLKGHRTIVANPDGRMAVNPTGGPELATAGTGDVLTGALAALLAAGVDPFAAAWATAYVHGRAGEIAAAELGTSGVLAGDVADALPEGLVATRSS